MKRTFGALAVVALLGCPSAETPAHPTPTPSKTPLSPNTPMNLDKPSRARVELDLAAIRGAVRTHRQLHGRPPASLDVLSLRLSYKNDMRYDPTSGEVKSATYPML